MGGDTNVRSRNHRQQMNGNKLSGTFLKWDQQQSGGEDDQVWREEREASEAAWISADCNQNQYQLNLRLQRENAVPQTQSWFRTENELNVITH